MKRLFIATALLALIIMFVLTTAYAYVIRGFEGEVDAADIKIDGRQYVLITDFCKAYGIEWEWDSVSRKITLRKNGKEIVFLAGSRYYYDGKKTRKLSAPLRMKTGSVWIPLKFAKYTAGGLFEADRKPVRREAKEPARKTTPKKRFKIKKVVIDPGHGGKDPGAISRSGIYEKNVILDVSKRLKKELEKKGIDVIMTRSTDKFVSLGGRTRIANKNNADLFVSIHANANRRRWIRGFEAYYLSEATDDNARALAAAENSSLEYEEESFGRHTKDLDAIVWDLTLSENRKEAIDLAGYICQEVDRKVRLKKNTIKRARFYVLKGAEMPAVLLELSYLSNKYDERNLKKSSYKQKLAEGIAAGVLAYKNVYEKENGFSQ